MSPKEIVVGLPEFLCNFVHSYTLRGESVRMKTGMNSTAVKPCNIIVFASGNGTNAERLIHHFVESEVGRVMMIVTNNASAGVIKRAEATEVPVEVLEKKEYLDGALMVSLLQKHGADLIVLAGYLKLVPLEVIQAFSNRIVNIHPALLPAYGGKGMYGRRVHDAVMANGEALSGITVHYVSEHYDEGEIIFQKNLEIGADWDASRLEAEIHKLEHAHFPMIVETVCKQLQNS